MSGIEISQEMAKAAKTFIGNSQEYCFLFIDWWPLCMTKSEWSGWMQAVGAAASIIGAFLIASWQYRRQLMLEKKVAVSKIRSLVASLSNSIELLRDMESANSIEMQRQIAILKDTLAASTITADHLEIDWIAALMAARSVAAQMTVLCEAVEKNPENLPYAKRHAGQFFTAMEDHEIFVANGHPVLNS